MSVPSWHEFQNSFIVGTRLLCLQPLMKSHFHCLISVELATSQMLFHCPNKWCFVRDDCSVYRHSCTHHITHLQQECHNSKYVIFQEKLLKVLKCSHFLWVERWHDCSSAVSFANCVMTLYLLKVHLQTFLSIPITQKRQILSCDTCRKWADRKSVV